MLSVTSNAEILDFECTFGKIGEKPTAVIHSVDMTNKTWERTEKGQARIFEDVVVSSNSISVTSPYESEYGTQETNVISRVDLSYSYSIKFHVDGVWDRSMNFPGQCKIIKAPSVEKAF
jgi:hypothetical protein